MNTNKVATDSQIQSFPGVPNAPLIELNDLKEPSRALAHFASALFESKDCLQLALRQIARANGLPVIVPDKNMDDIPVPQYEEAIHLDEIITLAPVSRTPLTTRRLELTYNQGGRLVKNGGTALAPLQRVYSVGDTPEAAIRALGKKVGWGEITGLDPQPQETPGSWYYRFWAGGTSMKAGGRHVPGGVLLDWWK